MTAISIQSNAMHLPLPDECVDLVVTSPPYFGLRSYTDDGRPVPDQVGGEPTPGEFIDALVTATAEMVRVLKPSGSIFVNLGDKYSQWTQMRRSSHQPGLAPGKFPEFGETWVEMAAGGRTRTPQQNTFGDVAKHVPTKSLMLLPERYRIAAVDRLGLIARAVIVWDKPSGLPESVCDRVRRSHEDWVHLTKQPRYFSAVDEIREPYALGTAATYARGWNPRLATDAARQSTGYAITGNGTTDAGPTSTNPLGKLPGSVWRIPTAPLTLPAELGVDHFAAFPPEWPKRIIQGWSPAGVCVECGEGRRPVVARTFTGSYNDAEAAKQQLRAAMNGGTAKVTLRQTAHIQRTITDVACGCIEPTAPTTPGVVLDPFGGTGTTAMVAHALGRVGISVDLSHDYCRVAQWRTHDGAQIAKVRDELFRKPEPQSEGQDSLFTFVAVAQGGKQ
jgi:DNA modification methylase